MIRKGEYFYNKNNPEVIYQIVSIASPQGIATMANLGMLIVYTQVSDNAVELYATLDDFAHSMVHVLMPVKITGLVAEPQYRQPQPRLDAAPLRIVKD